MREGTHRWSADIRYWRGRSSATSSGPRTAMRDFSRGMHGLGMLASPLVAAAFDLSRFRRMVDLGGATGHLVRGGLRPVPGTARRGFRSAARRGDCARVCGRPHRSDRGRFFRRRTPGSRPIRGGADPARLVGGQDRPAPAEESMHGCRPAARCWWRRNCSSTMEWDRSRRTCSRSIC